MYIHAYACVFSYQYIDNNNKDYYTAHTHTQAQTAYKLDQNLIYGKLQIRVISEAI